MAFGYIIRNETIVKGKDYENGILQIKTEGEKVASGENVFRYYNTNEEDLNVKIENLNLEIQKALEGQIELFPTDIKALDSQIDNKVKGLKFKNTVQEISENKNDIKTYLSKKSKIAGELSAQGSYINNLLKQKEQYENELAANSEYIKAPVSGVISYRIDNLEESLKPDNFENLNKEYLEDLDLKTGQSITTSTQMGKIVNNYEAYIATILKSEEAKQSKINQKVRLKLTSENEISSNIIYKQEQEDGSVLLVFKIIDAVEDLISYRKISFDIIWWSFEGLKVSNSAILYDNGLSYVVRNRGGYLDKILVKIMKQNDQYCIINDYSTDELKELGYTYSQINSMKNITIYDEILVNPNLNNL